MGFSAGNDSFGIVVSGTTAVEIDVEVKTYVGIFARLGAPANPRFYPYVMLGYGSTKFEETIKIETSLTSTSTSASASEEDFAYGVGANIGFTDKVFSKVEYMNYNENDAGEISGLAIGIELKF